MRKNHTRFRFLERLAALAQTGEPMVPCAIWRRQAFLLAHPDAIEEVFIRHADTFTKGPGYLRASRLLGNGLLTATGPAHAAQRRRIQPAFHRRRIEGYAATVVRRASDVAQRWTAGMSLDIAAEMQRLTLGIAGDTLFGVDLEPCAADVRRAVTLALPRSMDGLHAVVGPAARVRRARQELDRIADDLIARRLASDHHGDDVLGMLLARAEAYVSADADARPGRLRSLDAASLARVRDEAITLLLAAHDTISHALTWSWLLLAQHPDAAARLAAEVDSVARDDVVSGDLLPRLVYARSVLAEALRLFPPAWVIVRRASEAHVYGDTRIPSGALVFASPFVTHRDPRFFSNPLSFSPERWLDAGDTRPRLAYFPFGAGARSCIGEHFAWMEGTLVLATIARQWRLERADHGPILLSARVTLRPEGGVVMVVRER